MSFDCYIMSLLPLTNVTLSTLASGTAHPDSASKLLGAEADGVGVLRALVSVLDVSEEGGWCGKDRVKALVALSNLAQVASLRNEILRVFQRGAGASFEALLAQKEHARREFGNNKASPEHLLVIVLLFRVVDYRLGADDLLDLLSGDVDFALALIEALLKSTNYELALHVGLLRTLGEFVHPSTYFTGAVEADEGKANAAASSEGAGGAGGKAQDRSERSCTEFTAKVDRLVQRLMGSSLFLSVAAAVTRRLDAFARVARMLKKGAHVPASSLTTTAADVSVLVRQSLGFLYNAHLFMGGVAVSAAAFRQHLVVAVQIAETVILPFLENVFCEAVAGGKDDDDALFMAAQGCFQMLTVLYFRFLGPANEKMLRGNTITVRVLRAVNNDGDRFLRWPKLLGMMVLFNANVDSLGPVAVTMEETQQEDWPDECRVESVFACFKDVIERYKSDAGAGGALARHARARLVDMMEDPEPLPVARDSETLVRLCRLLESLMEADEEEDDDGDGIIIEDAESLAGVADGGAEDEDEEKKCQKPQRKTPPGFGSSQGRFRLLGHLPTFDAHKQERADDAQGVLQRNKEKEAQRRARREKQRRKSQRRAAERRKQQKRRNGANCPEEFRCALDGCIMKQPTRASTSGLVFEQESIEKWLAKSGDVCPVTGEALRKEDLEPDAGLARRIGKFFIDKALGKGRVAEDERGGSTAAGGKVDNGAEYMAAVVGGGFDNDDDLYKF